MKIVTVAIAVAALAGSIAPAVASASKPTEEEQIAQFNNCVTEYQRRGMGGLSAAEAFCNSQVYGDEGPTGGGDPERTYYD